MNNINSSKNNQRSTLGVGVYFDDPRLRMSWLGRMAARVASYAGYLFLLAATPTLLISEVRWMFYLGIFLALFFINYFIHRQEGDRPLAELPKNARVNLAEFTRPITFSIIERALDRSSLRKTNFLLEVLSQLNGLGSIKTGLLRMDIRPDEFNQKVSQFLEESSDEKTLGTEEKLQVLMGEAFRRALATGHQFIEPGDLFSALITAHDKFLTRLFDIFAIDKGDLEKALIFSAFGDQFSRLKRTPMALGGFIPGIHKRMRHRIMNRAWTSRPTPTLDRYSLDLTDLARQEKVGFLIGHKVEYERLVDALARSINPNVLLVGEEGIGKETIVAHLAFNISKDKVPEPLFDKRLVALFISELTAGATPDELQARLQKITDEIVVAGNVILYLPEFHHLIKTSGTAYLSAADGLIPIIKNNAFPVVGATYPREFKEAIETRGDLLGLFEVIRVNEITSDEAEEILVYESLLLEREVKVVVSFGAIKKAVYLTKKYLARKFLPASAGELLKTALSEAKRKGEKTLAPEAVVRAVEREVNVPIHEALEDEAKKLLNLETVIHEKLIDQEEAVKAVARVLREYRSGLTKAGKPIASFLFVGPTGVGKTELAKILAEIMFGSKNLMFRFDMTEYQDKLSFYRLIGSPDGKISGALTEAVLKKPYCLILLDEFEKAYPDILDLFLQVFDDGRLTDNLDRTVDFENTILIATSNAHSDIINEAARAGQTMAEISEYFKKKLTDVFKPELLNRFSKVVIFNNLSPRDVERVAALNLADFTRTVKEKGIFLEFNPIVIREIARLGYDPAFGARPIGRVIEEKLRAPLAEEMLKKSVVRGNKYQVVLAGEEFKFVET